MTKRETIRGKLMKMFLNTVYSFYMFCTTKDSVHQPLSVTMSRLLKEDKSKLIKVVFSINADIYLNLINPFQVNVSFLHPMKISEDLMFSSEGVKRTHWCEVSYTETDLMFDML